VNWSAETYPAPSTAAGPRGGVVPVRHALLWPDCPARVGPEQSCRRFRNRARRTVGTGQPCLLGDLDGAAERSRIGCSVHRQLHVSTAIANQTGGGRTAVADWPVALRRVVSWTGRRITSYWFRAFSTWITYNNAIQARQHFATGLKIVGGSAVCKGRRISAPPRPCRSNQSFRRPLFWRFAPIQAQVISTMSSSPRTIRRYASSRLT